MNGVWVRGARWATSEGMVEQADLVMRDGLVEHIGGPLSASPHDVRTIDARGLMLCAGFVDIHLHGGGGSDFGDGGAAAYETVARAHAAHGTTALMPALVACAEEEIAAAMEGYAEASLAKRGPRWLGVHIEGPFVAPGMAGALDPAHMRLPDAEMLTRWLDRWPMLRRMTLAPELPGGMMLVKILRDRGRIASIGHTDAMYGEVLAARERGCTLATHLYSAMSMLRRIDGFRHLGVIESFLLLDDLDAEIIADGCHLPPELLRLIVKCKPKNHLILVTDAMRAAGQDVSGSVLGSLKGGRPVLIEDGVAKLPDKTAFAGSIATADRLLRVMVRDAGVSLCDAVGMLTANPARAVGRADLGRLYQGGPADAVLLDEELNVRNVFIRGEELGR